MPTGWFDSVRVEFVPNLQSIRSNRVGVPRPAIDP